MKSSDLRVLHSPSQPVSKQDIKRVSQNARKRLPIKCKSEFSLKSKDIEEKEITTPNKFELPQVMLVGNFLDTEPNRMHNRIEEIIKVDDDEVDLIRSFATSEVPKTPSTNKNIQSLNREAELLQFDTLVHTIPYTRQSDIQKKPLKARIAESVLGTGSVSSNADVNLSQQMQSSKKHSGQLKYRLAKKARDFNRMRGIDRSAGGSSSSSQATNRTANVQRHVNSDF